MIKVKRLRTADCVVGVLSLPERQRRGRLSAARPLTEMRRAFFDHVGFTSTIANNERAALDPKAARPAGAAGVHREGAGRPEPLEHGA